VRTRTIPIAALALTGTLILAGCAPSGHPASSAPTSSPVANIADEMFATMMIPHHEQAVQMAEMMLAKDGIDPQISDIAQQISDTQAPEIEVLRGWVDDWGVSAGSSQGGHDMGDDEMLSAEALRELDAAEGASAERLFLTGMIAHHEGAIDMAEQVRQDGAHPDVADFATDVIGAQRAEIEAMNTLLAAESGARLDELSRGDARSVIDQLDRARMAERDGVVSASIRPDRVVLTAGSASSELAMPEESTYIAFAPYRTQTHECTFHAPSDCVGELRDTPVRLTVTDSQTGERLLDEQTRTFDNGFVGAWLPRGITADVEIAVGDSVAKKRVSTRSDDDPTCITDLPLKKRG